MYCTKCGTKAKAGDYYCRNCGAVVDHAGLEQVTVFPPERRTAASMAAAARAAAPGDEDRNWMAVAGLIFGIVAILLCFTCVFGFFAAVLGLIFGFFGRASQKKKTATAALILSVIGLMLSVGAGFLYLYYIRYSFNQLLPFLEYGLEELPFDMDIFGA